MQGMLDCGALAPFALPAEQGATHAGTHLQRGWARVGRRVRRRGSRRAGARRRGARRGAARRREQRLRLERDGQVALQRAAGHRALPQGDGLLPRRSGAAACQCGGRQGAAGARGGCNRRERAARKLARQGPRQPRRGAGPLQPAGQLAVPGLGGGLRRLQRAGKAPRLARRAPRGAARGPPAPSSAPAAPGPCAPAPGSTPAPARAPHRSPAPRSRQAARR